MDRMSEPPVISDWNDALLLLAVIQRGSFSAAAQSLGLDQATVSRRIAALERKAGRPLFHRRKSGAQPTTAGLVLAEVAQKLEHIALEFGKAFSAIAETPTRAVTISASEGIIAFYLAPGLLHGEIGPIVCQPKWPEGRMPSLRFVSEDNPSEADIVVLTLAPGELPNSRAALRVRHIGTMRFMPFAAKAYLANASMPKDFDAVRDMALLNHDRYRKDRGLEPWNAIVSSATRGPALSVDTTSGLFRPLVSGCGVALLPRYAHLYEGALTALDIPIPDMRIELWLAAHEDSLREPAVRAVYDTVADMFLRSPWFR